MRKTNWLAFKIRFPDELVPLYDFLQDELNFILSSETYRNQLEKIDYSQHKGNIWRSMRDVLKPRIKTWEINNKTWYSYILFENIRREIQSKVENIIIFNKLKENNMEINEALFSSLTQEKIFATRGRISNLKRANEIPELARKATFQLDYTVSAKQNFYMDEDLTCHIQNTKGDWIEYQIILPASLNGKLTCKVAKPRFMKDAISGRYFGVCSYEYEAPENKGENVLGVDIGLIKLYSAVALYNDGSYSTEYTHSKKLEKLNQKLKSLYREKAFLFERIERIKRYNSNLLEPEARATEFSRVSNKIMRLKSHIARLTAKEIVQVAKIENCKEIHIENLSWLGSQAGKWNHSEIHKFIEEAGIREGLKVIKVNAAYSSVEHPITYERGKKDDRIVTFSDGKQIDRDVLGAINLAVRNKGKKKSNKINKLKKGHATPKQVKPDKSKKRKIKEYLNKVKGNTQIVVFSPQKLTDSLSVGLWSLIDKVQPNSSLLMRHKLHGVSISSHY